MKLRLLLDSAQITHRKPIVTGLAVKLEPRQRLVLHLGFLDKLEKGIEHFKKMFQLHTGEPLVKAGKEEVAPLADSEVGQEQIVIQKR